MNASANGIIPIDYEKLFDRSVAHDYYGVEPEPCGVYYDDDRGMVVEAVVEGGIYLQDLIQFAPDAFAFTGMGAPFPVPNVSRHLQVIGNDDWIHFCLRLGAGGYEDVSGYRKIEQPSRVCTIIRYPAGTHIWRVSPSDGTWRTACLWIKPKALADILETSSARIPAELVWLLDRKAEISNHVTVPIPAHLHAAVDGILGCRFRGGVRRAYMYSKYLEIMTTLFQAALDRRNGPTCKMSEQDTRRIHAVEAILRSQIDQLASLSTLAREVGINRTKLIFGFRAVYGTSVEAYWRDWRMQEASNLLRRDGLPVSEVARRIGFAEVSSFSRAFSRHFGMLPSERRMGGRDFGPLQEPV